MRDAGHRASSRACLPPVLIKKLECRSIGSVHRGDIQFPLFARGKPNRSGPCPIGEWRVEGRGQGTIEARLMQLSHRGMAIRHEDSDSGAHLPQVFTKLVLQVLHQSRFHFTHDRGCTPVMPCRNPILLQPRCGSAPPARTLRASAKCAHSHRLSHDTSVDGRTRRSPDQSAGSSI